MTRRPHTPIPQRPQREQEQQAGRESRFRWTALALFGALALIAVAFVAIQANDGPEKLAFVDSPEAAEAPGHDGHDHSNVVAVPNEGDDHVVLGLRGEVPPIIGDNFAMPLGSEVIHVIVNDEGIWEFEGRLADGSAFWKVIDLNRGLLYDAGDVENAVAFP